MLPMECQLRDEQLSCDCIVLVRKDNVKVKYKYKKADIEDIKHKNLQTLQCYLQQLLQFQKTK